MLLLRYLAALKHCVDNRYAPVGHACAGVIAVPKRLDGRGKAVVFLPAWLAHDAPFAWGMLSGRYVKRKVSDAPLPQAVFDMAGQLVQQPLMIRLIHLDLLQATQVRGIRLLPISGALNLRLLQSPIFHPPETLRL